MWDFFTSDSGVRLCSFAVVLAIMASWELVSPRRLLERRKSVRWSSNLGLMLINGVMVRVLFPVGAFGVALLTESRGWGVFNHVSVPPWLAVVVAMIALDLTVYLQHVLFHVVPSLWRLHMVHHADLDFDVTTGLRFHSLEILLSLVIKCLAIVLLGAPASAVLFFEVLLNCTAMFNHSNVRIPDWLDRVLRLIIVTPDMHRVHHSILQHETNSNFGFNLPWWDFLFRTYRGQPESGHVRMKLGLPQFRDSRAERIWWMFAIPFIGSRIVSKRSRRASASKASV